MGTPRSLASACLAALLLFTGANIVAAWLTRNSMPRQVLRAIDSAPRIDVLALGSSLVQAGFDPAAFSASWSRGGDPPAAVNAGLGFTGPVQHLLVGRAAMSRHQEIGIMVYGFFDLTLTDPAHMPTHSLWGNYAMAFYTEPHLAAGHLFTTRGDKAAFHVARRVPIYVERGALWAKVEKLRRQLSGVGLPPVAENRIGRVSDFAALEFASPETFRARAVAAVQSRAAFTPALAELFSQARANGIAIVVVEMPMMTSHRERFYGLPEWEAYVRHIQEELRSMNIELVRAADWIGDSQFMDRLHLDAAGARWFSARLAHELRGES